MSLDELFVAVPVYRDLPCEFALTLIELVRRYPSIHLELFTGCSIIPLARNTLSAAFLNSHCLKCLFIDSDILFTPQDVEMITEHDQPIVSALCPKKEPGPPVFVGKFKGEPDSET